MTIAHSARKIIKTQRFIFRALPALLVSIFVLNACGGGVPVTVSNSSLSEAEIAKLRADAKQANDAKETADSQIVTLKDDLQRANDAKETADTDVTRLKNEAIQAGIAKTSADSEIKILKGQLSTAIGERGTANGMIATLKLQLQQAMDNQNPDDSEALGMLRNQLQTATGAKDAADLKVTQLTTALRLIEEARINFADWGGTAEAPKTTVKNAEGTGTEPLLNGAASVVDSGPTTNFIQGLATLDGKGFDFAGTPFVNARVSGGILLLAENSPSGVAFSLASGRFYAGLLPTTNLGALITDNNTSAIWDAKIMAVALADSQLYSNPSFKMQVIFDGSEGTINSGTVSSGVFTNGAVSLASVSSNTDISIQGKFGSDGLLYGTVNNTGTLTGLIGAGGAVGVFFNNAFAGGFVAYPSNSRIAELEEELQALRQVEYDNWEAGKTPDASPDTANPRYQFLQSRNRTLDTGATTKSESSDDAPTIFTFNTADFWFDGRPVGTDTNDGFATFTGYHSNGANYDYIGILDTTDLGAPLAQTSTALIWNGALLHKSTYTEFALTINVKEAGDGDIDAFFRFGIDADYNILLTGTFDANGVITAQGMGSLFTGNDRDSPTGTAREFSITGLIGADGALGIFGNESFGVGGFFVTPEAVPNPNVRYINWEAEVNPVARPSTINPRDEFLQSKDGTLDTGTTTENQNSGNAPRVHAFNFTIFEYDGRPVGTDTNDGYAVFSGHHSSDGTFKTYVGILDTTDLGAPLTETSTSLEWNGSFWYTTIRADFTLTIDVEAMGNGTIDAFFKLTTLPNFKLLLTGTFDENGVITAEAVPGNFTNGNRDNVEREIGRLPLTGLIGSDGAFAFYNMTGFGVGGFFVSPTAVPNPNIRTVDWLGSFNPSLSAEPVTASPANQFLPANTQRSAQSKLDTSGTTQIIGGPSYQRPTVTALNLDDNADNEVAFFSGAISGTFYHYAGVLSDVNVGLPLVEVVGGWANAEWGGKIQATNMTTPTDFTLQVGFDIPRIRAIVRNGSTDNYYYLDGTYTPQGVITGTVNYGTFGHTTLIYVVNVTPSPNGDDNGVLTGLIGRDGAVGVFVSGTTTDGGITIAGGTGATGFAGGFVAHPTAPVDPSIINFADWGGTVDARKLNVKNAFNTGTLPLLTGLGSVGNGNPQGNFVQGLATVAGQGFDFAGTGFDFAGTGLSSLSTEGDVLLLGENSPNGVAYSSYASGNKYYAGLLPTTNLGAPITDSNTSTIWEAKFGAISVPFGSARVYSNLDFKMQVIFDGSTGTISSGIETDGVFTPGQIAVPYTQAGVDNGNSSNFNIQGSFGSDGLLYGTVNSNPLTGLIGQDGAVGAFAGNEFAGGFVARTDPNVTIANWLDGANWLGGFNYLLAQPVTTSPANQFLSENTDPSDSSKLNASGTRAVGSPSFFDRKPPVTTLNLSGDTDNAVAFFSGDIGDPATTYHYAGILSDVNLGLPIDATFSSNPTAEWSGSIQATNMTTVTDLTLRVGFATPSVKAIVQNGSTSHYYYLDGTYSNKGVITGTVNYGTFSTTTLSDSVNPTPMSGAIGVLTGLIGRDGAVGVFVSGTTTNGGATIADGTGTGAGGFAGGFVVTASE